MLSLVIARSWSCALADISTAFLRAPLAEEVFVWPPQEFYPTNNCLWKLNKAMCGLRQSPQLCQSHFASVIVKLGFRRCKSDSNLYCHMSRDLYLLAYVDDLLVAGDLQLQQEFLDSLGKEFLVKITGRLEPNTELSFLGRPLRRNNGDSIDIFMPPKYIGDLLELYGMKKSNESNSSPSTGSSSLKRIVGADFPLTD